MKFLYILPFVLLFSTMNFGQIDTQIKSPKISISTGWGAGDNDDVKQEYPLFSVGLMAEFQHQFYLVRGQFSQYPLFEDAHDFRLKEIMSIWAYTFNFEDVSKIYVGSGVTYTDYRFLKNSVYNPKDNDLTFSREKIWSVPIEIGFIVSIGKRSNVVGSAWLNFNQDVKSIGYLMQYKYQLF